MSTPSVVEAFRKLRDAGLDVLANATRRVTSSEPYARVGGVLSQPPLVIQGFVREARSKAMAQLLGELNMPSREEVLALSQRLTHIETVLDDLGASLDEIRASRRAPEGRTDGARPRPRAAGEA